MNKVRRRLERRAYAAIEREGEALGRLGKIRAHDKVRRRKAKRLSSVRRECAEAIERFDEFEAAMDTLRGALECVDINTGELHRREHVQALIEGVAQRIESLGVGESRSSRTCATGRRGWCWRKRACCPGSRRWPSRGRRTVSLACRCWYLVRALHKRPARARHRALSRHLLAAYGSTPSWATSSVHGTESKLCRGTLPSSPTGSIVASRSARCFPASHSSPCAPRRCLTECSNWLRTIPNQDELRT